MPPPKKKSLDHKRNDLKPLSNGLLGTRDSARMPVETLVRHTLQSKAPKLVKIRSMI